MKDEPNQNDKESISRFSIFRQLANLSHSNNLTILREEESKVATDQCKQYKDAF